MFVKTFSEMTKIKTFHVYDKSDAKCYIILRFYNCYDIFVV